MFGVRSHSRGQFDSLEQACRLNNVKYMKFGLKLHLKFSKVFIYLNFTTQSKHGFEKFKNSMLKR